MTQALSAFKEATAGSKAKAAMSAVSYSHMMATVVEEAIAEHSQRYAEGAEPYFLVEGFPRNKKEWDVWSMVGGSKYYNPCNIVLSCPRSVARRRVLAACAEEPAEEQRFDVDEFRRKCQKHDMFAANVTGYLEHCPGTQVVSTAGELADSLQDIQAALECFPENSEAALDGNPASRVRIMSPPSVCPSLDWH